MTSKISFSKLVKNELKRLNWLLALQCLIFGLLIPFRVLLVLANFRANGFLSQSGKTLYQFFCANVGLGHWENTVVILGLGIISGLVTFGYLHSALQLDFFHSLAVKREKLFAAKFLGGFLAFVIPYVAAQLLAVPAGLCYGAFSCKATVELLVASLQGILFFLCSYSGTLIAVMLTGKLLTTILALGILGFYVPMLCLCYIGYLEVFFYTCVSKAGLETFVSWAVRYSSPWTFCVFEQTSSMTAQAVRGVTGPWPTAGSMLLTLAVAAALTVIALLIYRVRKTEAAGNALAFRPLETVIKLLLTIPTTAVAPLFAYELIGSVVWEIIFILLFGTLGCMIIEFIYRWDIRQVLCRKRHILITVAAAFIIFFSCRADIMGYNTYFPEKDSIESMAVCVSNMDHWYLDEDGLAAEDSSGFHREMLERLETEDFESYYRIAENGVDKVKAGGGIVYSDTTVFVTVKYGLKNGKDVYRQYMVDKEIFLKAFNEMRENQEFMESCYPIMAWSRENIAAFGGASFFAGEAVMEDLMEDLNILEVDESFSGGSFPVDQEASEAYEEKPEIPDDTAEIEDIAENQTEEMDYDEEMEWASGTGVYYRIPDDDLERLVEAYRKDLLAVSFEDGWYENQDSYLSFELPARMKEYGEGYITDIYWVNENFTNTWEVLLDILKDEEPSGRVYG